MKEDDFVIPGNGHATRVYLEIISDPDFDKNFDKLFNLSTSRVEQLEEEIRSEEDVVPNTDKITRERNLRMYAQEKEGMEAVAETVAMVMGQHGLGKLGHVVSYVDLTRYVEWAIGSYAHREELTKDEAVKKRKLLLARAWLPKLRKWYSFETDEYISEVSRQALKRCDEIDREITLLGP